MKFLLIILLLLIIPSVFGSSISINNVRSGRNISFQVSVLKTGRKSSLNTLALCDGKLFLWKNRAVKGVNKFHFSFKNSRSNCLILSYGLGTGDYSIIRIKPKARISQITVYKNHVYLKTLSNLDHLVLINDFGSFEIRPNETFEQVLRCGNYDLDEKLTYFGRVLDEKTVHINCFKVDAVFIFLCLSVFLNILLIVKR